MAASGARKLKFRNYKGKNVPTAVASVDDGSAASPAPSPEGQVPSSTLPSLAVVEGAKRAAGTDAPAPLGAGPAGQLSGVADLAPKKVNADLKRDVQPKLDILASRTQDSISRLVRAKLLQQEGGAAHAPQGGDSQLPTGADGAILARAVQERAEQQGSMVSA